MSRALEEAKRRGAKAAAARKGVEIKFKGKVVAEPASFKSKKGKAGTGYNVPVDIGEDAAEKLFGLLDSAAEFKGKEQQLERALPAAVSFNPDFPDSAIIRLFTWVVGDSGVKTAKRVSQGDTVEGIAHATLATFTDKDSGESVDTVNYSLHRMTIVAASDENAINADEVSGDELL